MIKPIKKADGKLAFSNEGLVNRPKLALSVKTVTQLDNLNSMMISDGGGGDGLGVFTSFLRGNTKCKTCVGDRCKKEISLNKGDFCYSRTEPLCNCPGGGIVNQAVSVSLNSDDILDLFG